MAEQAEEGLGEEPARAERKKGPGRKTGRRSREGSLYRNFLSPDEQRALEGAGEERDLTSEIEAARAALMRLLNEGSTKAVDVSRVALNVARLLEIARRLSSEKRNPVVEALQRIFSEIEEKE